MFRAFKRAPLKNQLLFLWLIFDLLAFSQGQEAMSDLEVSLTPGSVKTIPIPVEVSGYEKY